MNRLKIFLFIFCIAISLPLAYIAVQSYSSLQQEELSQLRFFSETLIGQMEDELARLIQSEENRTVDEYQYFLAPTGEKQAQNPPRSPLSKPESRDYILGYLQINPDDSWQTPLLGSDVQVPEATRDIVEKLRRVNAEFINRTIVLPPQQTEIYDLEETVKEKKENRTASFSDRFLKRDTGSSPVSYLGNKQQRVEEITAEQAVNVGGGIQSYGKQAAGKQQSMINGKDKSKYSAGGEDNRPDLGEKISASALENNEDTADGGLNTDKFQVEVAPFQSVSLGLEQVYIFRRIVINDQIYRQGFVLLVEPFINHLISAHFSGQPLAAYTRIEILRRDQGFSGYHRPDTLDHGLARRIFPPPFDFLEVGLQGLSLPPSAARRSLTTALAVLGIAMVLGLVAIYQSIRSIVALSERRSEFVSAVTHELKTPLTNIQMYVEMLEQGIAATPEREQQYLATLNTESVRLSALINNVLELAKLEKGNRYFDMQEGVLTEVLSELEGIMAAKLRQHGMQLLIRSDEVATFLSDRDVLMQILINLVDNSIKFSEHSPVKEIVIRVEYLREHVRIAVSDRGPGIPHGDLQKIFDEFYRVDNSLTRNTGGTGIGLALVKKFVAAMGGSVSATNNQEEGCTITVLLPSNKNT